MITKIKEVLKENQITIYQITENNTECQELYFIRKRLDMRRETAVTGYTVTVYRDFEEGEECYRGASTVEISDGMTAGEISEKLKNAYFAAGFVKNGWYPLPQNTVSEGVEEKKTNLSEDFKGAAMKVAESIFSEDTREDVFLNSLEIFSKKTTVHLVNSEGVDVAYRKYILKGEFVVQCPTPQDVETYESFSYDHFDADALKEKVRKVLKMTKDRAVASTAPAAGEYRVILSGDQAAVLMDYYYDRANAAYIYPGYSNFKVGDEVQKAGEDTPVCGDLLNLTLTATMPYSEEGIRMADRPLLKDGKLQCIFGASRYCHYLGVKPTGNYAKMTMPAGTVSLEEMKKKPYLHVVNFSDFQMDPLSGNFGGEIRLAYLFDGSKVTPVTGGSVNGSILTAQKNFVFSSELQDTMSFTGPKAVCLEGVAVAGC